MMKERLAFARFRALARRKGTLALCLALCALGLSATAHAQITTFDAPGAGTAANQGSLGFSINPSGTITGFDRDTNWVRHAFLRSKDGTITIIDAPGAGTCSSPCGNVNAGPGTRAYAINPAGTITGFYTASEFGSAHGYMRSSGGTFTDFDAPDAGTGSGQGTFPGSESGPYAINPAGAITGLYIDGSGVQHGFVRAPDGTLTEFDPPNSTLTFPVAISWAGAITGFYFDTTTGNFRGFLRAPDGTITAFDAPGAGTNGGQGQGTFAPGITPSGAIQGNYQDSSNVNHGFVRTPGGTFSSFDAPGVGPSAGQGTFVDSSNVPGDSAGLYVDASNVSHGFVRAKQGAITTFDPAGSVLTVPLGISTSGAITGYYFDSSGVPHGFLRSK